MSGELGKLMTTVLTFEHMIPVPGTAHRRPPHAWDPDLERSKRDLTVGEMFSRRAWGHRKLGNVRLGDDPPDLMATDLTTGADVTIELTQLAYEHLETQLERERRFKQAFYETVAAERPRFRGTAVILYFGEGKVPPAKGKTAERVLDELLAWMKNDIRFGHPAQIDRTAYPWLSKYVRQLYAQPTSEDDYRHDPEDPLVVTISGAGGRTYAEGDLPALLNRAIRRKLKKGYSWDILVVHNWADPSILSSAPEAAIHSLATAESSGRGRGISDAVLSIGRAVAEETQVGRRFGETWLLGVGPHEDLRRLDP
jgi:hypothetical protein